MPVEVVEEEIRLSIRSAIRTNVVIGRITRPVMNEGPIPCLLLLHEVGGVNPSLRATGRAVAGEGYLVFTPDMYNGRPGVLTLARRMTGAALSPLQNQPLSDLRAALAAMAGRPDVDSGRPGAIGY